MAFRPLVLVAAVAALALVPAAAGAAPPWSAPQALPGYGGQGIPAAVTPAGSVAAVQRAPASGSPIAAPSELVRLGVDGSLRSQTALAIAAVRIAPYAKDHFVVAGQTVAADGTIHSSSRVRVGTTAGPAGAVPLATLPGTTGQRVAGLASGARGDVALVTVGLRTRNVFLRRAGSRAWSHALTIRVGDRARDATVAVGPHGDVLVVWEDDHHIYARHRGLRSWGSVHRLGDGVQSALQAAIDGSGRLYVAWESQRVSEGDTNQPATVSYTTAAPGHGFGRTYVLERAGATGTGRYVSRPGVRLEADGESHATIAWTGFDGTSFLVRAMDLSAGHRGPAQRVTPAGQDAVLGDLAVSGGGPEAVVWRAGIRGADPAAGGTGAVFAAVRGAATGAFGAPEAVSAGTAFVPDAPAAVVDAGSRRALTVWPELSSPDATARVSSRAPIG